jgi:predicted nicotinamide N-methyase
LTNLARRRARLRARIESRYDTVDEIIPIGPLRIPFTRVRDADTVLNQAAEEIDRLQKRRGVKPDDLEHLPYWAQLWDSAYGVSQRLVDLSPSWGLSHPRVLDLGCGMGLTSAVAGALGADTLLADLEPAALQFAQLNTLPYRARTRRLNWRTDRLDETFDLIVGADILYEKAEWEYLEPFWRTHLAANGLILLGEPGRQTGDLFLDWIDCEMWQVHRVEINISVRPRPIRIFELRRREEEMEQGIRRFRR